MGKDRVYDTDPIVPYKTTEHSERQTQMEINALLARWGVTKSGWEWDPEHNKIQLTFQFSENVDFINQKTGEQEQAEIHPIITLEPPYLWHKASRTKPEIINWRISMRVLHWFMKSLLEMAYLTGCSKTSLLLPFVTNQGGQKLYEVMLPKLDMIMDFPQLESMAPESVRKALELRDPRAQASGS